MKQNGAPLGGAPRMIPDQTDRYGANFTMGREVGSLEPLSTTEP